MRKSILFRRKLEEKVTDYVISIWFKNWFNPIFTLFFNFRFLPFKQACHLPIFFYGRPKLLGAGNGIISIDKNVRIKSGMIKINQSNEFPCHSGGQTEILFKGKSIMFKGNATIGCGCRLLSYGQSQIIFGKNFKMSNQNSIGSCNYISFGDCVSIGQQNQIFDTNFHFVYRADSKSVAKNSAPIVIANNSWITNRCTIFKGTHMPAYSVLGASSMINRDYSSEPEGTCFMGSPAKPKIRDYYRIRKKSVESKMYKFFEHNNTDIYTGEISSDAFDL